MTVTTSQSRVTYAGDNVSVNFPIPFEFFLNTDIAAILTVGATGVQTTLTYGVDFLLTGVGLPAGGTLNKTTPLAAGSSLVIYLNPPITQQSVYVSNAPFPAATLMLDLDRQTQISQRLQDQINRTLRAPDGDVSTWPVLPPAQTRANGVQTFDANGLPTVTPAATLFSTLVAQVVYGSTAADKFTTTNGQTVFALSGVPASVNNLEVSLDGAQLVPVDDYSVSGSTLTLVRGTLAGQRLLATYGAVVVQNTPSAASVVDASIAPASSLYPATVASILHYGADPTGVLASDAALTSALAAASIVVFPPGTFKFTTATGFVLKGKRIQGAGRNATILQFPNVSGAYALAFQSVAGGYDTTAPGISGAQVLGLSNTTANGGIGLTSSDGGGCHGGFFSDVIVGGFQKVGTYGWDLVGSLNNGVYDNLFLNCFSGPTTNTASQVNANGWRLFTSDAPGQPNRCNQNTWINCGAVFNTGDGVYMDYASANTFTGFDREANGGWGFNVQHFCLGLAITGGDSESNTSGSINKAFTTSDIHVLGGSVSEAPGGTWGQFDTWMPGGTQAGKLGNDTAGNLWVQGTAVNLVGANPVVVLSGANILGFDSTNTLLRHYRADRYDSVVKASSAGAISFAGVTTKVIETTLTENITAITFPTAVDGQEISWIIKQAAGGGFTVAGWPASVLLAGGAYTMTVTASKSDVLNFRYNADFAKWFETPARTQNL